MLLVVLGAGASYDYAPTVPPTDVAAIYGPFARVPDGALPDQLPWRPPLTDGLVANDERTRRILNALPGLPASGLVGEIRRRLRTGPVTTATVTLESILDDLTGSSDANARELLGFRFYIHALISECGGRALADVGGDTNQSILVRTLDVWSNRRQEPVLYVTFNYDTLLEAALESRLGWHPYRLESYVEPSRFKLFKLHGSCSWKQYSSVPSPWNDPIGLTIGEAQAAILGGPSLPLEPDGFALGAQGIGAYLHQLAGAERFHFAVPALAVPLGQKAQFTCPSAHVAVLKDLLPQVDHILAIGWKGGEPDFVEMLRTVRGGAELAVVTPQEASANAVATIIRDAGVPLATDRPYWRSPSFSRFAFDGIRSYIESID